MIGAALPWIAGALIAVAVVRALIASGRIAVELADLVGDSGRAFEAGERQWMVLHRRRAFGEALEPRRRALALRHGRVMAEGSRRCSQRSCC